MEIGRGAMEAMEMTGDDAAFWRGRRVFLTGHTGFKGSWLALWLQRKGAFVTGYALDPPSNPSMFVLARVALGMEDERGDVRDLAALRGALVKAAPEVVFHMAAQSLVRPSYADPVGTYATNVMGVVNLLEAVREAASVRAVVIVTSDKCYENKEWLWGYRENEAFGGGDPYSSSKGCAELVTAAYRRSFFTARPGSRAAPPAVATARAGNVIGGGDWSVDRLAPDAIRAFSSGATLRIRHPDAVRPWQHVLDPLAGYLRLAEALFTKGNAFAEGWNFGPAPGDEQPVRVLADRLADLWGDGARWERDGGVQLPEHHYLRLDCAKARARLGWISRLDLETALRLTVAWRRAHLAGADLRTVSLEQIAAFETEQAARHNTDAAVNIGGAP